MNSKIFVNILLLILCLLFVSCNNKSNENKSLLTDSSITPIHKSDSIIFELNIIKPSNKSSVITDLKTTEKVIALTFDACETKTPSYFDNSVLDFITKEEIPVTIFLSGKFVRRNSEQISKLSNYKFIELENHSLNHFNGMQKFNDDKLKDEVIENEKLIFQASGVKTKFFRFPAGKYNKRVFDILINLNYSVVHWTFESGDASKQISQKKLYDWVIYKTKPGSILIFHINRRGYRTGKVLPELVNHFKKNGYKFVKLEDYIR